MTCNQKPWIVNSLSDKMFLGLRSLNGLRACSEMRFWTQFRTATRLGKAALPSNWRNRHMTRATGSTSLEVHKRLSFRAVRPAQIAYRAHSLTHSPALDQHRNIVATVCVSSAVEGQSVSDQHQSVHTTPRPAALFLFPRPGFPTETFDRRRPDSTCGSLSQSHPSHANTEHSIALSSSPST